jgi:uncharacterized membrane protein YphA (DoxX/SURF4 family)
MRQGYGRFARALSWRPGCGRPRPDGRIFAPIIPFEALSHLPKSDALARGRARGARIHCLVDHLTETLAAIAVILGFFTRFFAAACAIDPAFITFHIMMPRGFGAMEETLL